VQWWPGGRSLPLRAGIWDAPVHTAGGHRRHGVHEGRTETEERVQCPWMGVGGRRSIALRFCLYRMTRRIISLFALNHFIKIKVRYIFHWLSYSSAVIKQKPPQETGSKKYSWQIRKDLMILSERVTDFKRRSLFVGNSFKRSYKRSISDIKYWN